MEYWNNEEYKMFFAIPAGCIFQWDAKGFAIKVTHMMVIVQEVWNGKISSININP